MILMRSKVGSVLTGAVGRAEVNVIYAKDFSKRKATPELKHGAC